MSCLEPHVSGGALIGALVLLVGCGGEHRCSEDHREFYAFSSDGELNAEDLLRLEAGPGDLSQSCNYIPFHTSGGGFQSADVYHVEPRIELQNHLLDNHVAGFVEWRLRKMHGGELDGHMIEIWPDDQRVFTTDTELKLDEDELNTNVRIEAAVHLVHMETGEVTWLRAAGAAFVGSE